MPSEMPIESCAICGAVAETRTKLTIGFLHKINFPCYLTLAHFIGRSELEIKQWNWVQKALQRGVKT